MGRTTGPNSDSCRIPGICSGGARWLRACSVALLLNGCGAEAKEPATFVKMKSEQGTFLGVFSTEPAVVSLGENTLRVELSRKNMPVTEAELILDLWMDAHGHGGGGVPEPSEIGDGKYAIDHVVFPMPGSWSIDLDVRYAELEDHFEFELDVH